MNSGFVRNEIQREFFYFLRYRHNRNDHQPNGFGDLVREAILAKRKTKNKLQSFARIVVYILGYRPDEFGLVPDGDGFIAFKDLIKALHEEPGWGYVRQSHINEIFTGEEKELFDWEEGKIRARKRNWKMDFSPSLDGLPKILFLGVRRKAHAHAMARGLRPTPNGHMVLARDKDMALRIGTRKDRKPVLLEIRTEQAMKEGVPFYPFEDLFLAGEIPATCISGPPLPKEAEPPQKADIKKVPEAHKEESAGTFVLDPRRDPAPYRREKGKKPKGWKEDARKLRKKRGH